MRLGSAINKLFRPRWKLLLWLAAASIAWYLILPKQLFDDPYSLVVEDRDGP